MTDEDVGVSQNMESSQKPLAQRNKRSDLLKGNIAQTLKPNLVHTTLIKIVHDLRQSREEMRNKNTYSHT